MIIYYFESSIFEEIVQIQYKTKAWLDLDNK